MGLSCRVIARLAGSSKSSVQRYLAGGTAALDRQTLVRERLERYYEAQLPSLSGLSPVAQLRLLERHAKKYGLYRYAASEPEEKVFL
jgi:hypothetical protein